jgi:hypothetical protein
MSGNVNDTNAQLMKQQIDEMILECEAILARNEEVQAWEGTLTRKYKHLHNTSSTLFKFIVSNFGTPRFDKVFFTSTVDLMLKQLGNIQHSVATQEAASQNVGNYLAESFIPQLKKQ